MLCQFSFKNFWSYKDATVFDFQAASIPEFNDSIINTDKAPALLPVSAVYGPNGGGKSNLLKALGCLLSTVVKPIADLGKARQSFILQTNVPCVPFLLDNESDKDSTEFQVFFRVGKEEYQYNLAILNEEIVSESLYWKTIGAKRTGTVFEREGSNIELGSSINKASINKQINPKMPYLSFLAINYDIPVITEVISWFESCIFESYSNPFVDSRVILGGERIKKDLIRALNDLDIDIEDYRISEEKRMYTKRTVNGEPFELPYEYESDGTKKLIAALPVILLAIHQGRLVVIDELDAKLHPKLLRYIIKLFHNTEINKYGAQLLFTSHDLTTMRNDVFRRDEIWFACENDNHESGIYSLYDIRDEDGRHISNNAAFDKQYLEGRYGADPYLQNILGDEWDELEAD